MVQYLAPLRYCLWHDQGLSVDIRMAYNNMPQTYIVFGMLRVSNGNLGAIWLVHLF
jgi:hypothetical protein